MINSLIDQTENILYVNNYLSANIQEINNAEAKIYQITQAFNKKANHANDLVCTCMMKRWSYIKEKMLYVEKGDLDNCSLFSNAGLKQIECLTKTAELLDRAATGILIALSKGKEAAEMTCSKEGMTFSDKQECAVATDQILGNSQNYMEFLERIVKAGGNLADANTAIWESLSNQSLADVEGCMPKINGAISELDRLNIEWEQLAFQLNSVEQRLQTHMQNLSDQVQLGIGFPNIGDSCYMNATLQMLFRIPEIISLIDRAPKENNKFLQELQALALCRTSPSWEMLVNLRTEIFNKAGNGVLTKGEFAKQDAHEFLVFILDELNWRPMKTHICTLAGPDEIVHYGDEQATHHMTLEIKGESLQEIINNHRNFEEMSGCLEREETYETWKRRIQIKEYPAYLFMLIKRFENIDGIITKNTQNIQLPADYLVRVGEKSYEIIGYTNHHSDSLNEGHYTADLKKENVLWINYNDDLVTESTFIDIGRTAYIILLKLEHQ